MNKKHTKKCFLFCAVLCLVLSGTLYGQADVIATFNDMTTGGMRENDGQPAGTGVGFSTDYWQANTSHCKVREDNLAAPSSTGYSIVQTGTAQCVQVQSIHQRRQYRELIHENLVGSCWISFLAKNTKSTNVTGIDFDEYVSYWVNKDREISLRGTNLYVQGSGGTGSGGIDVSSKYAIGETALVLCKFMPNAYSSPAHLQVWVNPNTANGPDGLGTPDFEQLSDLGWGEMDRLKGLGLLAYDTDDHWGGLIDAVYISQGDDAFYDVVGVNLNAYSPSPESGEEGVGVKNNGNVDVTLEWKTGRDDSTSDPQPYNPDIKKHYLYMSSGVEGDTDLELKASLDVTGLNESYSTTLNLDGKYYWLIEEGLDDGTGSANPPGDPNNYVSAVWEFETLKSVPVVTAQPEDVFVGIGDTAELSVSVSTMSSESYQWYKSLDDAVDTGEDDSLIAGADSNTLTVYSAAVEDEAYYYCEITNSSGTTVSDTASLGVKRLMAKYSMDQADYDGSSYLDSSPEDGTAHDAQLVGEVDVQFVTGADGTPNGAVKIDPNSVANAGTWNPSEFSNELTAAFWVEWDGVSDVRQGYLGKSVDLNAGNMWFIRGQYVSSTSMKLMRNGSYGPAAGPLTDDNQWQFVAFTVSDNNANCYVNGINSGTSDFTLGSDPEDLAAPIWIGRFSELSPERIANASMDDVRIYNYALSPEEIAQLYYDVSGEPICIDPPDPAYDLSGPEGMPDCKVDMYDFVQIAKKWFECGLYPASLCFE
ncbi:Immunoglobulin I-set domain protein [Sedimentisphaera cyanobacteriorum]|uniref:Immunoglobulin I-set domain protein n=1 Tax=Sedimentisphaera cyanobacteriorum TaxID=1940790 RepID=A0A1Q2HRD5_9BACT|nr:LamG-like jellyroll fold domain-containing protein [Sedimentisphaera cyanobacteriorum]AQQ10028.1 Immunoglobulin I-set domain protein [Sedimentisphaera cyanobacteriorum]